MRRSLLLLALPLCAACTTTDPNLDKPCGQRGDAGIEVGTGAMQYVPIGDAGVVLETDAQGCKSLLMSVACEGLGPQVTLSYGVQQVSNGADLTGRLFDGVNLQYDSITQTDQAWGISADFLPDAGQPLDGGDPYLPSPWCQVSTSQQLIGQQVLLWARARDFCPASADGGTDTVVTGYDSSTCTGCLYQACGPQLAACDADCMAIQACLDARCYNLSAIGSQDENACQVFCQMQHPPAARAAHIALALCVQGVTPDGGAADAGAACQPPCLDYAYDYRQCVEAQMPTPLCQGSCLGCPFDFGQCCQNPNIDAGIQVQSPCAQALCACYASPECPAYRACLNTCTSLTECLACGKGSAGVIGEQLFERYQFCIESSCIAMGWLPHISQ
jgi:hypothetical protein